MSVLRSLSVVLVLATAVACAPASDAAVTGGPAPAARTTLKVTNDSHSDVTVYVLRSGMRFRLGTVASLDVKDFVIPSGAIPAAGGIRLMADPIGLTTPYATEPIAVPPGAEISFRVKKQITNSYYAILTR